MVHPGTTNFNGLGNRPGRSLIARMEPTADGLAPFNAPRGGRTLEPGRTYILQATTDFGAWANIRTNTADFQGLLDFIDSDTAQFPHRFYRTLAP
jgi:hypothetical protein